MKILLSCLTLFLLALNTPAISADPDGSAKIRLMGNVAEDARKRISIKELESIGTTEAEAFNPYEKKADTYKGVWMKDLVAHFGNPSTHQITTIAIDGYTVTFDKADWESLNIMIATQVNGKYIGFKDKGPMRIVFVDFDKTHELYEANLPKWMWMIQKIDFK